MTRLDEMQQLIDELTQRVEVLEQTVYDLRYGL